MSIAAPPSLADPAVRRWTRDEYYRMGELGLFREQRVQLIDGEILLMSPQKFSHYSTIDRVAHLLSAVFGDGCWVRMQAPLTFGTLSEPEPDVSVVAGARDDYTDHPTTALLVVEVSHTTLAFDRTTKASLYASAPILDYWIVNLADGQVEVHRDPRSSEDDRGEAGYSSVTIHRADETVTPLDRPDVVVRVSDLLP